MEGTSRSTPSDASRDIDQVLCADIIPAARQHPFRKGDRISITGWGSRSVTTVALGALRFESILHDGRRQVLGFFLKGEPLQRVQTELDLRYIALTNGILYTLKETDLNRYGDCHFASETSRSGSPSDWTERIVAQNILLGRCTATERVVAFLVDIAARIGTPRDSGTAINLPMKRDDIADHLGLNTETVSRQFSKLKTGGLLDLPKPGQVLIKDIGALTRLSPFGALPNRSREYDAA